MERKCIYCNTSEDLSQSDIIPDALTNAKIINKNVCRINHNNKFSDLFENEVINKLALITNELDIKSSKSSKYAQYETTIKVDGIDYKAKISSDAELFYKKMMRSLDGKYLIGLLEDIKKIKNANEINTKQIDVNQIEIEKITNIDISIFFSQAMKRLIAKIAYEWYCVCNNINGKMDIFEQIIQFIIVGTGTSIVSFVVNEEFYHIIDSTNDFGGHTLLSYIGNDNSVNIIVSLFGIAAYNVRLCESVDEQCNKNILFQKLMLDTKRIYFEYDTLENFNIVLQNSFVPQKIGFNMTAMLPKDMRDKILQYKILYASNHDVFQNKLVFNEKLTEDIVKFLLKNIESVLQSSVVTIRGLKRFVNEHIRSFDEKIQLNPQGTNKKLVFMFYLLFILGQSNDKINNLHDLNKMLKDKFSGEKININDELASILSEEIFSNENYSEMILLGAKEVLNWDYC